MKKCYKELKEVQEAFNDEKEDELLLKCIKCEHFRKKENGYYCIDKPIRTLDFDASNSN